MDQQAPRVFVSYSDDSAAHAQRVLELAQWLRGHGVDARIDQFEDSPEQGWPRWIYAQIRESDFVLVVCTRDYLARCIGEVPRGVGADKAVHFESHLSLQELHDAEGRNRKFIPVLFDDDDVGECVPLPLRGATHYRMPGQREELYRRLSDQPKVRPAPLGALRTFDDDSFDTIELQSSLQDPREQAALDASDSLQAALISREGSGPKRRSARSWWTEQRKRLITVGAFGVAFLATALFINASVDEGGPGPGPESCSIQLTDPSGNPVDDIRTVSLELPAGQTIAVTVENGKTLTFACPAVAVNAKVRVERGAHRAEAPTSPNEVVSDDGPDHGEQFIVSQVQLSPTAGVRTIRLAPSEINELAGSEPEGEPDEGSTGESVEDTEGLVWGPDEGQDRDGDAGPEEVVAEDTGGSSGGAGKGKLAGVEILARADNDALLASFQRRRPTLEGCFASMARFEGAREQEYRLSVSGTGTVSAVETVRDELGKYYAKANSCIERELGGWNLLGGGTVRKYTGGDASLRLVIKAR